MKHLLLATGLALASAVSASATVVDQVTSLTGPYLVKFIPSGLVSPDSPRLLAEEKTRDSHTSYTCILFNDSFQEVKRVNIPAFIDSYGDPACVDIEYCDLTNDAHPDFTYPITQTVFNNDNDYEYITWLSDRKSYKIVNEKGETLAKIIPPEGWAYLGNITLFKTETGFYLSVYGYNNSANPQSRGDATEGDIHVIYKIDKETSSIQQIRAYTSKMDVNPRMVRQTPITVTLDENTDYTSIDVINMSGRVVQSVPVKDEKTVSVDTSRLNHGVYVVKASGNSQSQETCKIVVQ